MNKFLILIESFRILKNWYILPLVYFKIYKKPNYILNLKNGLKIKLRNNSTDIFVFTNIWIIKEYTKIFSFSNETVIDVGAHIGIFSLYAWKNNVKRIFAYEPIKENWDLFKENMMLNNINNVKCENIAVYDSRQEVEICFNQDFAAHSIIKKEGEIRKVKSIPLKKIFDEEPIQKCDILKLDCEGSEYKILGELPDEYFHKIKKICLEYHIFNKEKNLLEELNEKLERLGFSIELIPNYEDMGMLYATSSKNSEK